MHGLHLRIFAVFLVAFANDLQPRTSLRETTSYVTRIPSQITHEVYWGWVDFRNDLKTISHQVKNLLTPNP